MNNQLPVVKVGSLKFDSINTTVGLITPEIAAQLLERNFENNRNVGTTVVRRYSRLIKDGKWTLSDPIKFNENGILIDGQHRLNAVIHSGESAPFVIITGYPHKTVEVLDQGMKRDARHVMQFRGMGMNCQAISIIRVSIDVSNPSHHVQFSPAEIVDLVEFYSEGLNFACRHSGVNGSIKYAPVLASVFMAYSKENHERLDDFLYCWHTGIVRKGIEDNAAILLRNQYLQNNVGLGGGREVRCRFFFKTQSALSYFLKGNCPKHFKETKKLLWGNGEFEGAKLSKILKDKNTKQS